MALVFVSPALAVSSCEYLGEGGRWRGRGGGGKDGFEKKKKKKNNEKEKEKEEEKEKMGIDDAIIWAGVGVLVSLVGIVACWATLSGSFHGFTRLPNSGPRD